MITLLLPMSYSNLKTLKIPCKRYVKAYLENHCGAPVNLQHLPELMEEFRRGLSKTPCHKESRKTRIGYEEEVSIIIPENFFYRYGWEMEDDNIRDFNRLLEAQVKYLMRQYVSLNHSMGIPVASCIRSFQSKFGFEEPIWSFESIKKDFDRNGLNYGMCLVKEFKCIIDKIFLSNLSEKGTVSKKFIKEYANG